MYCNALQKKSKSVWGRSCSLQYIALHCIALQCTRNALQCGAIHKSKSEQKSRSLCEAGLELQTACILLHCIITSQINAIEMHYRTIHKSKSEQESRSLCEADRDGRDARIVLTDTDVTEELNHHHHHFHHHHHYPYILRALKFAESAFQSRKICGKSA